ncbi:sigma-54-dependent Fis family transcriptional regulator [Nocardia otitidiscaviarum]|uniref:Fis family transcriptional regulator n=1 Tax=Nocardia otitidiscaviarum TaxID=1823 RepID=A0A516NHG3_9NOCA|nr:helix-turn-helix domain-containing protein [Nocardia otitidiscaviarum]MBF6177576.1 Fis family transcriptional regulator [Nocardia otitidiscaviarum]MCP9620161.1 Fis family transcriptional regulator [Nocardia otitidiscaviarum]QDP78342.1 Fis family transcriptional regulator [Nocardia otitidiscaviarum]
MDAGDDTIGVERAREVFVSAGDIPSGAVSDLVVASWQRSVNAGVDDVENVLDRTYLDDLDLHGRFARCAVPVIDRLEHELSDMPVSIALADQDGRVLLRRDNQRFLTGRFDGVFFAPGFVYTEDTVGTNGVGTALAAGKAVLIRGAEHYAENITVFACAGAPVRDPLTGAVQGILDLSCLAKDANGLMLALVREAARGIESELRAAASLGQQAVLDSFLRIGRMGRTPTVALAGEVFMTDARADAELSPHDRIRLRELAAGLTGARGTVVSVDLPTGRKARVRSIPVPADGPAAGVVLQVDLTPTTARAIPHATRRIGLAEVPGDSPAWRMACSDVLETARVRRPLVMLGEPGVGKRALIAAAHRHTYPTRSLVVVDCRDDAVPSGFDAAWNRSRPATIVLAHLNELPDRSVEELAARLENADGSDHWLAVTMTTTESAEPGRLDAVLRHFEHSITVPALRHHIDDLRQIVPRLLRTLAPRRAVHPTPDAMRVLLGYDWPGNIAELRDALRTALARRPAGDLRRADLPESCFAASRRVLTPIEVVERDAIVRALVQVGGNRHHAARMLGIARSSLYRKIESYGIRPTA